MKPAQRNWLPHAVGACIVSLVWGTMQADAGLVAQLRDVRRIWGEAPHSAFTDLVRWRGTWYCAFREGLGHARDRGKLRILTSLDGTHWNSAGVLEHPRYDLRDAALAVTPDDQLLVLGGAQEEVDGKLRTGTFSSITTDGRQFSTPQLVFSPGRWLWRITWNGKEAYGVSYNDEQSALHRTNDGVHYETIAEPFLQQGGWPTEARVRFDAQGTMYCLHRRDRSPNTAFWGSSKPPYRDWTWQDVGQYVGGPNFLQIPSGEWLVAGRKLTEGGARTVLSRMNADTGQMTELLQLPSGGDTSYCGMVWHDGLLWLSYYSSHEGKAQIYFASVELKPDNEAAVEEEPIRLGTRLEPLWDPFLIKSTSQVRLTLQRPIDAGPVLRFDKPWEGLFSGYATIIRDGERYRAYYRGRPQAGSDGDAGEVTCYAESCDGHHWEKPSLGIHDWQGQKENNIILANVAPATHNFSPFMDVHAGCPQDARFKGLGGTADSGLMGFKSADGIHWQIMQSQAVFRDTGWVFDSQNVSFWSEAEQQYVLYYRRSPDGIRAIARATSPDFVHWSLPLQMTYSDTKSTKPSHDLYTNQTHPYFRAPHLYVSTAARFFPGRRVLTDAEAEAIHVHPKYFQDTSDAVLMTSRPGENQFSRTFLSALIRPGLGAQNWVSRTNYPALNLVPTGEHEMSLYVNQDYGQPTAHLRRYVFRLDGLACMQAPYEGGDFTTRTLSFTGKQLRLNFSTSAAGGIQVEVLDSHGQPMPGFSRNDCPELIGNELAKVVRWRDQADLSGLIGKPVQLRFWMHDADLYAIQFE